MPENNLLYQPLILHPAHVTKEVQFPPHRFLHDVDACALSFDLYSLLSIILGSVRKIGKMTQYMLEDTDKFNGCSSFLVGCQTVPIRPLSSTT